MLEPRHKIKKWSLSDFITHKYEDDLTIVWYMTEKRGLGFCQIMEYKDDPTYLVFSHLSVSDEVRKLGMGSFLINYCIDCVKNRDLESVYLWVKKDSWMMDWYQRLGFVIHKEKDDQPDCMWMYKKVNPKPELSPIDQDSTHALVNRTS